MYLLQGSYVRSISFIGNNAKRHKGIEGIKLAEDYSYKREYDIVNSFLYGNSHDAQILEYGSVKTETVEDVCISGLRYESELEYNVVYSDSYKIFTINFFADFSDVEADEFIKFRKAMEHNDFFKVIETDVTLNEMVGQKMSRYIDLDNAKSDSSSIIELNKLTRIDTDISYSQFDDDVFRMLYGCVTTDEGWRFVSKSVTEKQRRSYWNSREFIHSFPFANGVLIFNETQSEDYEKYKSFQREYWKKMKGRVNYEYFDTEYTIGGMEHGYYHLVEHARLVRLVLIANLSVNFFLKEHTVAKINGERQSMLAVIDMLHGNKINELEGLAKEIFEAFDIFSMTETVEKRLDLAEADTMIKYEMKTNMLATIIAIMGLYFTIAIEFDKIKVVVQNLIGFMTGR